MGDTSSKKDNPFSQRLLTPYMVGIYLGVNSIEDFYLLVDGPDCTYMKTQYITHNHDLYANLSNLTGFHRITNTALHPIMMALSREERIYSSLSEMAKEGFVSALGITPMPMAAVTAVDYKRILRKIEEEYKKPAFEFKNKSLIGDWMDGYAEFGKVLARDIRLKKAKKRKNSVAIVGYLYDRNEFDNIANIEEIKRLFKLIGVDVVSVWFDGGEFKSLENVSSASLIVSFGYLKEAARILSERLDTPLIEMDYPVGIENTSNLLLQVGEFFGLSVVKRVVDDETREVVRRIEPLIEPYFIRLKAAFSGDPVLYNAVRDALMSLGVRFEIVVIVNTSDKRVFLKENGDNIIFEPTMNRLVDIGLSEEQIEPIGLFIGNSDMSPYFIASGKATVEIGFPSYFSHSIACEPYIGYKGFLHLISRIVKELRYAEVRKVFRDIRVK